MVSLWNEIVTHAGHCVSGRLSSALFRAIDACSDDYYYRQLSAESRLEAPLGTTERSPNIPCTVCGAESNCGAQRNWPGLALDDGEHVHVAGVGLHAHFRNLEGIDDAPEHA